MTTTVLEMPKPPGPAEIIAQAREGQPDALTALYHEHASALMAVAYRLTGSRADAEDVLHDVFLGLPEALGKYEERGSLSAWLKQITTRVALTRLRSRARTREIELDESVRVASHEPADTLERVHRAIRSLPTTLRVVFVLREIEGYSHSEIGEILGIRANTSEVRLHRAVRALRAILGDLE
jgi:RNA polymerase sigma-70 factor, ECF subfamily